MKFFIISLFALSISCMDTQVKVPEKGTLAYDVSFLKKYDSSLIELTSGNASVLVSAKYQGKVFTSAASGDSGASFGWINYKAFGAPLDPHINVYGGENRYWLGPEGGRFSLYFQKDDSMVFANWKTPAVIDTEPWEIKSSEVTSVSLHKNARLKNYRGAILDMSLDREVKIFSKEEIGRSLGITPGNDVQYVGYGTTNRLTNTGDSAWTEATGMPCIWMLDMFTPSDATTIVIPHKPSAAGEKVATTNYFGEIPKERIMITDSTLFFLADGKSRGKLGITPGKALPFAGSYDAVNNVLTITKFSVSNDARYLNQEWNTTKPVFSGDAVNAYNDGPLAAGGQLGPFYEIESVSPAAQLAPGAYMLHQHDVFHFTGDSMQLNVLAEKLLGVSLGSKNWYQADHRRPALRCKEGK